MRTLLVARREFSARLRTEPPHGLFALTVVFLGAVALLVIGISDGAAARAQGSGPALSIPFASGFGGGGGSNVLGLSALGGGVIFFALSVTLMLVATMVAAANACATFAREGKRRDLQSLLLTGLHPVTIVTGKFAAAAARSLLVLLAGMPLFAVAWLFGGVAREIVVITALTIIAITVTATAICSLLCLTMRNVSLAMVYTYALLIGMLSIGPLILAIGVGFDKQDLAQPLTGLSLPAALASVQPDVLASLRSLFPLLMRSATTGGALAPLVSGYPVLLASIIGYVALSALLLLFAARTLDPYLMPGQLQRIKAIRRFRR